MVYYMLGLRRRCTALPQTANVYSQITTLLFSRVAFLLISVAMSTVTTSEQASLLICCSTVHKLMRLNRNFNLVTGGFRDDRRKLCKESFNLLRAAADVSGRLQNVIDLSVL